MSQSTAAFSVSVTAVFFGLFGMLTQICRGVDIVDSHSLCQCMPMSYTLTVHGSTNPSCTGDKTVNATNASNLEECKQKCEQLGEDAAANCRFAAAFASRRGLVCRAYRAEV